MIRLGSLGYVVAGVKDFAGWDEFAEDILGFQIGSRTDDTMGLRMDERPYRLMLQRDASDDIIASGWQLHTRAELEGLVAQLQAIGATVHKDDDTARLRQVDTLYWCMDPNGVRQEFFVAPVISPAPFKSRVLDSPFMTGRLGMGHYVLGCRNVQESIDFYTRGMGLILSGYIRPPGTPLDIAFLHAHNGRYHSLAFGALPGATKLKHIGLEIGDFNDVGRAYDRVEAKGMIARTIGQHPNAKTQSFYMKTPGSFQLELFYGEVVCDDSNWEVATYTNISTWGHKHVA